MTLGYHKDGLLKGQLETMDNELKRGYSSIVIFKSNNREGILAEARKMAKKSEFHEEVFGRVLKYFHIW